MKKTSLLFLSFILAVGLASAATTTFTESSTLTLFDESTDVNFNSSTTLANVTSSGDRIEAATGDFIVNNSGGAELEIIINAYNTSISEGEPSYDFYANSTEGNITEFTVTGLNNSSSYAVLKDGQPFASVSGSDNTAFEVTEYDVNYSVVEDNSGPSISLSLSDSNIDKGSAVDISCSSSDNETAISSELLEVENPSGTTTQLSCGDSYTATSSSKEYTVDYTVEDAAGNSKTETKTFSVSSGSSSSGGGGGGGGGGGSFGSTQENSYSWFNTEGTEFSADLGTEGEAVRSVEFETSEDASPESITSRKTDESEISENAEPAENVRSYMDITLEGVENDKISSASITFSVDQSWADQQDEVVMSRYNSGWEDLETEPVNGKPGEYVAQTPGFSYFAVRGVTQVQDEEPLDETEPPEQDNQTENTTEPAEDNQMMIRARNEISTAEKQVSEGDPGYESLQQAREMFDQGEYRNAEQLANTALETYRDGQQEEQFPLWIVGVVLLVLVVIAAVLFLERDFIKKRRAEKKLEEVTQQVKSELRKGQKIHDHYASEKIDQAERAIDQGNYTEALEIMEQIEWETR